VPPVYPPPEHLLRELALERVTPDWLATLDVEPSGE
jgi:hypothetical protein